MARSLSISFLALFLSVSAWAGRAGEQGVCMAKGQKLELNNEDVLQWKKSTPNGWHGRGFVQGTLVQNFKDRTGHDHFELQIGDGRDEKIEIVYNQEFGNMPSFTPGTTVVVCGDYITARDQNRGYPPSPDGAIIHWVHGSPNGRHEDGFISVNGKIFGQEGDARGGR